MDPRSPALPASPARRPKVSSGLPFGRSANPGQRGFEILWAATVIVPALIFAAAAFWSWRAVEREARGRLERTVDMLHEHALRSFETQEAILEAVGQRIRGLNPEAVRGSRELHDFLAQLTRRAQPSGGMIIAGPDNVILNGSFAFPSTQRIDLSDRDYVRAHRGGYQGTYVGAVIHARPQNTTVFSVSRRAPGSDMLVVSSLKPGYFEDFYRSVAETDRDSVALLRGDGAILARIPGPADPASYAQRFHRPVFDEVFRSGRAFASGLSPVDGRERLYGLRQVGSYPVLVTYGLSSTVLQAAWMRQLAVSGTICTIAALLLMLFTLLAQRSVQRERAALAAAQIEAERRAEAESRLRHAQRVDALGQIVGGVAHDFNNVVMAVMAGTRTIGRRAEDPAEVRRITGLVHAAAERGSRLTGRMLAFARREEARSEVIDVADALEAVTDLLAHTLGSGHRVSLHRAEDLPVAQGDRTELETVIVNLVINARDAMPAGGEVSVSARDETVGVPGASHAAGLAPGRYVRIAVADRGIGMDADTLARVGEAFFTTKEPGRGTGLGLAMARGFAEHAGGALRIESEPGRGTTVTLWIAAAA